MKSNKINGYIKANFEQMSDKDIAKKCGISANAVEHRRRTMELRRENEIDPAAAVQREKEANENKKVKALEKRKRDYLIEENDALKASLNAALEIKDSVTSHEIKAGSKMNGEATIVAVASDWHVEETVAPDTVNGLNTYNLDMSRRRADQFFRTLLKLSLIESQHTTVKNIVLALLGDFISGNIHDEIIELTSLPPVEAAIRAQEYIISGIQYLLDNSEFELTVVCHSGNHGRITKTTHFATEAGNSLEYMMYKSIASHFRLEKRVKFIVPNSYHSYMEIYGKTIRFHHGHSVKFGGGVGGITIPVNKAIAQWNRSRTADIDVFGHFHQAYDGGNFIANGSMIGYNVYAISIKASYERPAQMVFAMHSKLGHYVTRRVYFETA